MRWRRHRALVLSFAVAVVALVALAGGRRVTAVTSSGTGAQAPPKGVDVAGTRPFFDDRAVHELRVEYDPRDYRRMIARFRQDGTRPSSTRPSRSTGRGSSTSGSASRATRRSAGSAARVDFRAAGRGRRGRRPPAAAPRGSGRAGSAGARRPPSRSGCRG